MTNSIRYRGYGETGGFMRKKTSWEIERGIEIFKQNGKEVILSNIEAYRLRNRYNDGEIKYKLLKTNL